MNEPTTKSTGIRWLSLIRGDGQANVGAGIERLARLAAAAHQQQAAQAAAGGVDRADGVGLAVGVSREGRR